MLKGKTAVITGSNRGIGFAVLKVFAKQGAAIWACARTLDNEFEDQIRKIADEYAATIKPVCFDVADDSAVKEAVKRIGKESSSIDILVNNAGISVEQLFNMTTADTMRRTMEVNFLSQVHLAQLVSRYMIKQKRGSIINVASVAGIESEQGGIAYGSSKACVIFATKTMALELGRYGIRVNSVAPGFIDTDMWKDRKDEIREKILNETPLHRQGTPEEVANVILFLASNMSSFITSQNIVVDGGRMGGGNIEINVNRLFDGVNNSIVYTREDKCE